MLPLTLALFFSRVSKGFSSQQTMQACGCVETFTDLLKIFLQAVNVPTHRQLIQTGVRQYLHRMVVCLEKEILPFVPVVLENLLKQPEAKELHDFLPLMNQLIMKFKVSLTTVIEWFVYMGRLKYMQFTHLILCHICVKSIEKALVSDNRNLSSAYPFRQLNETLQSILMFMPI